jgi:hypothetical protein
LNEIRGIGDAQCAKAPVEYRSPSLTEQMTMRKAQLEQQLEEVNKVLAGLEKNPEAAELFNAISRLGGLR